MDYLSEIREHFKFNRIKLALILSKKYYEEEPDNVNSLIFYSKALIENNNPFLAIQIANEAVDNFKKNPIVYLNRAEILYRTSIFQGALYDIENYSKYSNESDSNLLKVKILAALENFEKAKEELEKIKTNNDLTSKLKNVLNFCIKIKKRNKAYTDEIEKLLDISESFPQNDIFWLPIWISNNLLNKINNQQLKNRIKLLEFISLVDSFRILEAQKKLDNLDEVVKNYDQFEIALKKLNTIITHKEEYSKTDNAYISDDKEIIEPPIKLISARFFNLSENINSGKRKYLTQFDESNLDYVAVEIIIKNPFYKIENKKVSGLCIWYLNDTECGRNKFEIELDKRWDMIEIVQSWGSEKFKFWKQGNGRLDTFIDGNVLFSKSFLISENEIVNTEEIPKTSDNYTFNKQQTQQPTQVEAYQQKGKSEETLKDLLDELHSYIGLASLKQSLIDFITYINFINERKKKGIKTEEQLELHCIFLGNPGTGKTTIARLLGKIFKAMGILENGHVVEVDRSGLVGQFIGETAVKTDKIITDALGGILFIDEAYTLKKPGISSDFGQEAIDILLKRMEDLRGKFVVIAAGYPGPMKDFVDSNPGLQSRFTHTFIFEDYQPDELLEIFKFFAKREEYFLSDDAEKFLLKKFIEIFENRDETFGNARLARKIFSETKIQIGKRFQNATESDKENFSLNVITLDDIKNAFGITLIDKNKKSIEIENLNKSLSEIEKLIGLSNFKREADEIVKLAKYYIEEGEDISDKFNYNFLFAGQSGTGKKTAAKSLTDLLFNLGSINKNRFTDVEHHSLIGNTLEQSLEKMSKVFDRASGGVLFISGFDILFDTIHYRTDLSNEFVENFYKKLLNKNEKLVIIADISNEFLFHYPKEFSILKSVFNKTIEFDDYSTNELLELIKLSLEKKNLTLNNESINIIINYIENACKLKNQFPQNLHLVKYITDSLQRKHLLKISEIPKEKRTPDVVSTITENVVKEIIESQIIYQDTIEDDQSTSIKKYLDDLNKLVGLTKIKGKIQNIINSEKLASIRRERGLSVIPKSYHGLFIGNHYTGKTTIAKIYAGILKELGILNYAEVIEIDSISISSFTNEKNLIQIFEGKLLFIENSSSLVYSEDIIIRETISRIFSILKENKDKFVLVLSDTKVGINLTLDKHNELRILFSNEFIFDDYTPREMLEIAFGFTQQYGYKLDEGAWQLLLEIFSNVYEKRDVNFLNTKAIFELLFKAIKQQEDRLSKLSNVSDTELTTISYDDIKNIYQFD